jgi:hypothetical protein
MRCLLLKGFDSRFSHLKANLSGDDGLNRGSISPFLIPSSKFFQAVSTS